MWVCFAGLLVNWLVRNCLPSTSSIDIMYEYVPQQKLAQMRIRFGGIQGLTFHVRRQYRSSTYIVAQRGMRHHRVETSTPGITLLVG